MSTAVDDGMIRRNPCRIKGAGQEHSPERPVLTAEQVFDLAASVRSATAFSFSWPSSPASDGELAALRRRHIDLTTGTVTVELSVVELIDGSLVTGPPKSEAGRRIMSLPPLLVPEITTHLERFSGAGEDALVFTGPKGASLRRSNFSDTWRKAITAAGLPGLHFHDLRHAGNHFAAGAGASLKELMAEWATGRPALR